MSRFNKPVMADCCIASSNNRLYGRTFEVATLVRANCDDRDVQFFLDSDIGVFILEENRIDEAKQILAKLKGE